MGSRPAEQQPESRTGRTELRRRCQRQVELERFRQQEHAVNRHTVLKIGELHRAKFIAERGRPSIENLRDRDVVGDAKRKIEVGEAIAAVHGERTHSRAGYDTVIRTREPKHALADGIPLLDGEHAHLFSLLNAGRAAPLAIHASERATTAGAAASRRFALACHTHSGHTGRPSAPCAKGSGGVDPERVRADRISLARRSAESDWMRERVEEELERLALALCGHGSTVSIRMGCVGTARACPR